jgi:hypothetical protein
MTIIRRVVSAARPPVNTSFETLSTALTNIVDTFWGKSSLRRSAKGRIAITSAGLIDCGRRFGGLGVGVPPAPQHRPPSAFRGISVSAASINSRGAS